MILIVISYAMSEIGFNIKIIENVGSSSRCLEYGNDFETYIGILIKSELTT